MKILGQQGLDFIATKFKELSKNKVETVEGKGLSTNDFTTAEQTKLKGIEDEANKTIIVNDLTTGGVDKALSAEQGKVLFQNVDNGKIQIANAIIDKGETGVSNRSSFKELATKIKSIKTGYGVGDSIKAENLKTLYRDGKPILEKVWEYKEYSTIPVRFPIVGINVDGSNSCYICTRPNMNNNMSNSYGKVIKLSSTGQKIWETKIEKQEVIISSATNKQGTTYVATSKASIVTISSDGRIVDDRQHVSNPSSFFRAELATDEIGNMYASDDSGKIIKVSPNRNMLWEYNIGISDTARIKVDNQGNVYALHRHPTIPDMQLVIKISPTGQKLWGVIIPYCPQFIPDNQSNLYIGDFNGVFMKLSSTGQKLWELNIHFGGVTALTVDGEDNSYSCGADNIIRKISPDGKVLLEFKDIRTGVRDIATDSKNDIYIIDQNKVIKLHETFDKVPTSYEVLK